jgi:hypothetical protein
MLIVTGGCGLVQSWGGPIVKIRPGDIVWCPPGEKHWHGGIGHVHVPDSFGTDRPSFPEAALPPECFEAPASVNGYQQRPHIVHHHSGDPGEPRVRTRQAAARREQTKSQRAESADHSMKE